MGGKVAATMALDPEMQPLISKLVIEDISPHRGAVSDEYHKYVKAMRASDLSSNKSDIAKKLAEVVTNSEVRHFLITNVRKRLEEEVVKGMPRHEWILNLEALDEWMEHIMSFQVTEGRFEGPTLVVTGAFSNFVRHQDKQELKDKFFPKAEFVEIPHSGHWVHTHQPILFADAVVGFLTGDGGKSA